VVNMAKANRNFPLVSWSAELELYAYKIELSADEVERARDLFSLTRARLNALEASMKFALENSDDREGD